MNKKKSARKSAGKVEPVKRGRGRPPGSKNKPKDAAPAAPAPARKKAPAAPAKKAAKKVAVKRTEKKAGPAKKIATPAPAAAKKRGRGRPPGARNRPKQNAADPVKEQAPKAPSKRKPRVQDAPADPPDMIIARIKDEKTFNSMSGEVPDVKTLVSAAVFNREIRSGATHYIVTTDMSSSTPSHEMLVYDNEVMEVVRDGERLSRLKSDKAKIGDRIIIGNQPYKVLQEPEKWVQTMGWIGVQ